MENIKATDRQYVANTYNRYDLELVCGKGVKVWDAEGKEYIDLGSGIGVTALGLGDEGWKQAVIAQLDQLQHASNWYYTQPCARLAKMLCQRTGMKKVFFSNSGAEANECAIKVARKYAAEKKGPQYYTIVTLEKSFHGRTITTLAATGQDRFHVHFQPLTPGFISTPANDIEMLKQTALANKAAAIMVECVQGEGGVLPLDAQFLQQAAAFAAQEDIVFIVDEVQTGNGRTGKLYAYENFGIQPDVVSTAKALSGGLPLGATLMGEKVQSVLGYGDHGSTFGGNPVSCAAAVYTLGKIDDALLEQVREKSAYIFAQLTGAPGIVDVTGLGLMIGIRTVLPATEVVKRCMARGVLCLTAKDKVRLLPALTIPMEDLKLAVDVLKSVCAETRGNL